MDTVYDMIQRIKNCRLSYDANERHSNPTKSVEHKCFRSIASAAYQFHGDDAVGHGNNYMVIADGVSGTVNCSGILARILVSEAQRQLRKLRFQRETMDVTPSDFKAALEIAITKAIKCTKRKGRLDSTFSAVYFDKAARQMFAYTIGDCKCILLRDGAIIYESVSLIYDFNVPAVVSNNTNINYSAEVHVESCAYQSGDICLLFSDGVHDNLFTDQILECAEYGYTRSAEVIAKRTIQCVVDTFTDSTAHVPFAVAATAFCHDALREMEASETVSNNELQEYRDICAKLVQKTKHREFLGQEIRVKTLAFYTASKLVSFAQKRFGKKDDATLCVAILS